MAITWRYADNYGELPTGEAEKVEALVEIAEQLDGLNNTLNEILILLQNKP